jgi:hypothetical protein
VFVVVVVVVFVVIVAVVFVVIIVIVFVTVVVVVVVVVIIIIIIFVVGVGVLSREFLCPVHISSNHYSFLPQKIFEFLPSTRIMHYASADEYPVPHFALLVAAVLDTWD